MGQLFEEDLIGERSSVETGQKVITGEEVLWVPISSVNGGSRVLLGDAAFVINY